MAKFEFEVDNIGEISDGSHSFEELYYHRMVLFAAICNSADEGDVYKSKLHHDGTMYDDYFIVGIETPEGHFSYHYHINYWSFFEVMEMERAPEWDGHTPADVIRLMSYFGKEG